MLGLLYHLLTYQSVISHVIMSLPVTCVMHVTTYDITFCHLVVSSRQSLAVGERFWNLLSANLVSCILYCYSKLLPYLQSQAREQVSSAFRKQNWKLNLIAIIGIYLPEKWVVPDFVLPRTNYCNMQVVIQLLSVSIIPPWLSASMYHLGDEQ
jgi:hypothetical protein